MPLSADRVSFTPLASIKLREFLSPGKGKGLRIFLENGQYVLGLDAPAIDDYIFLCEGFELFVDPQSLKYVSGLRVDFVEDGRGSAFELSNAFSNDGGCREGKGTCGCSKRKV